MKYIFESYNRDGSLSRSGFFSEGRQSFVPKKGESVLLIKENQYPYKEVQRMGISYKSPVTKTKANSMSFSHEYEDNNYIKLSTSFKMSDYIRRSGLEEIEMDTYSPCFPVTEEITLENRETGEVLFISPSSKITDLIEKEENAPLSKAEEKRIEKIANYRSMNRTKTSWDIDNSISPRLVDKDNEVDTLKVFNIRDNKRLLQILTPRSESVISSTEPVPTLVEGYKNNVFVSSRVFTPLTSKERSDLWFQERALKDESDYLRKKYEQRVKEEEIEEATKDTIIFLRNYDRSAMFIDAPFVLDSTEDFIELDVSTYLLFNEIIGDLFIVVAEQVGIHSDVIVKEKMTDRYVSIERNDHGVPEKKNLYFWLEDKNGRTVSEIAFLFHNGEKIEEEVIRANTNYIEEKVVETVRSHNLSQENIRLVNNAFSPYASKENPTLLEFFYEVINLFLFQLPDRETVRSALSMFELFLEGKDFDKDFLTGELYFKENSFEIHTDDEREWKMLFFERDRTDRDAKIRVASFDEEVRIEKDRTMIILFDPNTYIFSGVTFIEKENNELSIKRSLGLEVTIRR